MFIVCTPPVVIYVSHFHSVIAHMSLIVSYLDTIASSNDDCACAISFESDEPNGAYHYGQQNTRNPMVVAFFRLD